MLLGASNDECQIPVEWLQTWMLDGRDVGYNGLGNACISQYHTEAVISIIAESDPFGEVQIFPLAGLYLEKNTVLTLPS